jgi:L-histidine N-alpha-methyltransferase
VSSGVATRTVRVDVLTHPGERERALRDDVRAGLTRVPKELPPKWFYDARGSVLFEQITQLPEYYLTSREHEILRTRAGEIAALTVANTLVELGSGASEKTRVLLDAMRSTGHLRRYVPFDVSEKALRSSAARIAGSYPELEVHGVVGDFERHLDALPEGRRRMVAFLGSSIGNLTGERRAGFLRAVRDRLAPSETFLLGADLVKDPARLEAAYDDSVGVTAEFNRNVLSVVNAELGADFVPERFAHVARFNREREWIEMLLRSEIDQTVRVDALDLEVVFAAGEEMRTEISDKFRRAGLEAELAAAGFRLNRWWTDREGDFALTLSFAV